MAGEEEGGSDVNERASFILNLNNSFAFSLSTVHEMRVSVLIPDSL